MEKQKTIKNDFFLEGKSLQTGRPAKIFFYPESENKGIIFARRDLGGSPSMSLTGPVDFATDRRSKVASELMYVETVEHILAALWGAGIDNARIELDGSEPPAMDGSASDFLEAIQAAGCEIQDAERNVIVIKEPVWAEDGEAFLGAFPSDTFKISYVLEYPHPAIGRQFFSGAIDETVFAKEIAPARTFCLKAEAEALLAKGYGKGADLKNTLVMDDDGPIGTSLRFPDEPVRHKVMDLIGDLYVLGRPIKGRVVGIRSGHKLNLELVKKIKERCL